jgi:long-chain acyl-CoA synthetase
MSLGHAVRRAVQINRNGTALKLEGREVAWGAFEARVAKLAGALRGLGVGVGDRVAILALNSHRYLEFFFGAAWAGAVFVPINIRLADEEIVHWLGDSASSVLFVDAAFADRVPGLRAALPALKHVVFVDDGAPPHGFLAYEAWLEAASAIDDVGRAGDDLAALFYTGGTTGRSKGVMLTQRNLAANAFNVIPELGFDRATHWLHAGPMFHIADGVATFAITMVAGTHSFIPRFDPLAVMRAVQDTGVTHTLLVPTMINLLVNHPELGAHRLDGLRSVLYGASPMPAAVIAKALEVLPNCRFTQAYGQTEAAPVLTLLHHDDHQTSGPRAHRLASAGQAVLGVELAILDAEDRPVPVGEVGEICARGDNVMPGYWRQPEQTASALRNGWLHTGDGGRMDADGYVYVVDRIKDMIVTGGENVYSAEVENALYRHPAVAECAVIGVPHDTWGEAVHAIVRLKPGQSADSDALMAHCRAHLANFKLPRTIDLRDQPLPVSGAGKILKSELRKPFWAGRSRAVN